MKYASYYLSALALGVPLMFTMCGPMYSSRGKAAVTTETPMTFYQLSTQNGEGTPASTYKSRDIEVTPTKVAQCTYGELDLVAAAMTCKSTAPFIVTVKDGIGEYSVFRYDLTTGYNPAQLLNWFVVPVDRTINGDKLDVFACLDGNNNGQCVDEMIINVNQLTGQMLAAGGAEGQLTDSFCTQMRSGALLFHSQHNLSDVAGTTVSTPVTGNVSGIVQEQLRNLNNEGTPTPPAPPGQRLQFPVKLVKYEQAACPPPAVRTNGCFVKGTKVNVTDKDSVAIEKLHVGQKVYLADGRYSKISRVVAGPEHKPVIAFKTESGAKITVTSEHPLLTRSGMKLAKEIAIGDELKDAEGKFVTITSIATEKYKDKVYNMELEGTAAEADHTIVANGLLSGELYLQNKMSGKGRSENANLLTGR